MRFLSKFDRYLRELRNLVADVPDESDLADLMVADLEKAKRVVWLLVATGNAVSERVLNFLELSEEKVREEAWGGRLG